jgi:rubrerythrin
MHATFERCLHGATGRHIDSVRGQCYRLAFADLAYKAPAPELLRRRVVNVGEKIELGTKHECDSCGAKYYDFGKADKPCPACGAVPGAEDEEE